MKCIFEYSSNGLRVSAQIHAMQLFSGNNQGEFFAIVFRERKKDDYISTPLIVNGYALLSV